VFQSLGGIHDIESNMSLGSGFSVSSQVFSSHWAHLSVLFLWASGIIFHLGWCGNYDLWLEEPLGIIPIGHSIWDPNFTSLENSGSGSSVIESSGLYNWLLTIGYKDSGSLFRLVISLELLSLGCLSLSVISCVSTEAMLNALGRLHGLSKVKSGANIYGLVKSGLVFSYKVASLFMSRLLRVAFHRANLIGYTSILWSGHLVHCSIPVSRGLTPQLFIEAQTYGIYNYTVDSYNAVLGSELGSGSSILSFILGFRPDTSSIYLSDISHHHLSLGCLAIWSSHMYYSGFKGLGHRIKSIDSGSSGLFNFYASDLVKSFHLQISLGLFTLGVLLSGVSQVLYVCPSYFYFSHNIVSASLIYVHHSWVSSLLVLGAFSHLSLFLIRDFSYNRFNHKSTYDLISRVISHKAAFLSHLSWVSLFLGFHVLGVFMHNDVLTSFGMQNSQLVVEPIMERSKWLVYSDQKLGSLLALLFVDKPFGGLLAPLSGGDFLLFHSVSLSIHVCLLILFKGSLDGLGSRLFPDKAVLGFGFPCDGPGRGGTCDISAWDAFYLSSFWVLNANSWMMFGFNWKHILASNSTSSPLGSASSKLLIYQTSSNYLNGWFRDYLWFNSSALIRGYDSLGCTDLSVWSWTFLAAHLCWATSFMFLISWRGYWQELIEVIIYMHLKSPLVFDLWDAGRFTPLALSIVQARFIGLFHFASGLIITYAAFVWGASS
jgi:photosystem I P700 chlorophyll a apoprotein A2